MKNRKYLGLLYPITFVLIMASLFGVSDWMSWTFSTEYVSVNYVLFIMILTVFLLTLLYRAILHFKNHKDELKKLFIVFFCSLLVCVFVISGHHGNEQNSAWMMSDAFDPEVRSYTMMEPKTYIGVPFSIMQRLGVSLDSFDMIFLSRIAGAVFLTLLFYTSRLMFKDDIVSILACIAFIGFYWARWNMITIYYAIYSLIFIYLSIYFIILNRNKYDFALACMSAIIAAYIRYELAVTFGIAFLFYAGFFSKGKRVYLLAAQAWLMFIAVPMVYRWSVYKSDIFTQGIVYSTDKVGLFQILSNSLNILKYNITSDFVLPSFFVSLFTFAGLIISIALLWYFVISISRNKVWYEPVLIFAAFIFVYSAFLLLFNIQGYRSVFKYSIMFFPAEIIVVFFSIHWVMKFMNNTEYRKYATYITIALFLTITGMTTDSYAIQYHYHDENFEDRELDIMTSALTLDSACLIAKVFPDQPTIDFYYGLQKNSVIFGLPPDFYQNLNNTPPFKCIYFHFKNYPRPKYDYRFNISEKKVDETLNNCNKTVLLEPIAEEFPSRLVRYDCNFN